MRLSKFESSIYHVISIVNSRFNTWNRLQTAFHLSLWSEWPFWIARNVSMTSFPLDSPLSATNTLQPDIWVFLTSLSGFVTTLRGCPGHIRLTQGLCELQYNRRRALKLVNIIPFRFSLWNWVALSMTQVLSMSLLLKFIFVLRAISRIARLGVYYNPRNV